LSPNENKINFSNNLIFLMFLFYRSVDFTHVNMLLLFYIIHCVLYFQRSLSVAHCVLSLFEDKPNYILPDASVSKTTKSKWLLSLCETFIDKYVFDSGDINCLVQQTHELEFATLGHYNCRAEGCESLSLSLWKSQVKITCMLNDKCNTCLYSIGFKMLIDHHFSKKFFSLPKIPISISNAIFIRLLFQ